MSDDSVHFQERDRWLAKLNRHGSGGPPLDGSPASAERLAKLEGAFDSYQKSLSVVGVLETFLGAITIAGFTIIYGQISRVDGQIARIDGQIERAGARTDGLPQRLADEFKAMRAEMAAQTSAIAASITAARGGPQVIVVSPPSPRPPEP